MKFIKIKLKELKPSEYNPRVITEEEFKALEDSMQKFGYVEPIVYNKRNNHVIGGHQRLKILSKTLNPESEIDAVELDLDDYQEKALNLALNKVSGDWDEIKLNEVLLDIKNNNEELLKFTGFNNNEITNILNALNTDIPDLHYDGEIGNQDNIRYNLTFYFDNSEDYLKAKEFFKTKTKEPNTQKLLELIA